MRHIAQLVSVACVAVLLSASAASAQVGRVWTYPDNNGGYFEQVQGKQWREFVNNDGGVTFQFREVHRDQTSITLYDDSRGLWVRIAGDRSFIRFAGSDGWRFLYNGRWD